MFFLSFVRKICLLVWFPVCFYLLSLTTFLSLPLVLSHSKPITLCYNLNFYCHGMMPCNAIASAAAAAAVAVVVAVAISYHRFIL